jgi:hypothetical protein
MNPRTADQDGTEDYAGSDPLDPALADRFALVVAAAFAFAVYPAALAGKLPIGAEGVNDLAKLAEPLDVQVETSGGEGRIRAEDMVLRPPFDSSTNAAPIALEGYFASPLVPETRVYPGPKRFTPALRAALERSASSVARGSPARSASSR